MENIYPCFYPEPGSADQERAEPARDGPQFVRQVESSENPARHLDSDLRQPQY